MTVAVSSPTEPAGSRLSSPMEGRTGRAAADHRRHRRSVLPAHPARRLRRGRELGTAVQPPPIAATTGAVDEDFEVGWSGLAAPSRAVRRRSPPAWRSTSTTAAARSGSWSARRPASIRPRGIPGRRSSSLGWPGSATLPDPAPTDTASSRAIPATCSVSWRPGRRRRQGSTRAAKESCRSPRLARRRSTRRFGSVAS